MTWAAAVLLAALSLAFMPSFAVAECERVSIPGGPTYEQGCERAGGSGSGGDGNWFTSNAAQTIYWLLGVAGSGGAAIFGWTRVRRRRRELRTFLNDVETTFAAAKASPDEGLPKLEKLRRGLQASHDAHRLEDAQFLELDRRLADYMGRVRVLHLERWFPSLPMALFTEIRTVIGDGHFSQSDLSLVEKRAIQLEVPAHVRQDLLKHLSSWAKQDVDVHPVRPAPFTARKIAVIARK